LIQAANAIIGQSRARAYGAGASFVPNHAQREIVALTVVEIAVIADVHGLQAPCPIVVLIRRIPCVAPTVCDKLTTAGRAR
jgi:hypothetical protein